MPDIDFLGKAKRSDQKPKAKDDKKKEIIWSSPEDNKPLPKETSFSLVPFFIKNRSKHAAAGARPPADKNRIKNSREEILKLIKKNEIAESDKKNRGAQPAAGERKAPKLKNKNFLTNLLSKFNKPSRQEILLGYQAAFNSERNKRARPPRPAETTFSQAKEFKSAKSIDDQPGKKMAAKSEALPRAEKAPINQAAKKNNAKNQARRPGGWLNFLNFFKRKKSPPASSRISSKIILAASPLDPPAPPKPAAEPRSAKTKEKISERTEPIKDSPKVLETNLIKGEIITFFEWRNKTLILMTAILIPALLVGLAYFGLDYYQKYSLARIKNQADKYNGLLDEIKQEEAGLAEILQFQDRLKKVSQIFSQHIYWTNFFKFLEDNTIKDVYYNNFDGDTGGRYALQANGKKFVNITEQINSLNKNSQILEALAGGGRLAGGSGKDSAVTFELEFSITKDIFFE